MPTELEERLAAYGSTLLETQPAISLDELRGPATLRTRRRAMPRMRRLAVAAAAGLVITLAASALLVRRSATTPAVETPATTPVPVPVTRVSVPVTAVAVTTVASSAGSRVAMLPGAYPALAAGAFGDVTSQLTSASLDAGSTTQASVGRLDAGRLSDVVGIINVPHGTPVGSGSPTPITIGGRPATVFDDPNGSASSLVVVPGSSDLVLVGNAARAFADTQIDSIRLVDGPVGLHIDSLTDGYSMIAPPATLFPDVVEAIVNVGSGRAVVTVSAQPQFPHDHAQLVDVNGNPGWQSGGHVSWRQQPSTWVAVNASNDADAIAIARAVNFVDKDEFITTTGRPMPQFDLDLQPAPPSPSISAFGESVMLGAANALQAGGVVVDARQSQQAATTIDEVTVARDTGWLGDTVVIQIGTNGTVTADQLEQLVQVAGDRQVYFLTVHADTPWIAPNNELIRALPDNHPNVHVIDWQTQTMQIADQLSQSDGGIHLHTKRSIQFYANMIFDAIGRNDLDQPLPAPS